MSTITGPANDADTQSVTYSLFHGPNDTPLIDQNLATFLDTQCLEFGNREAIVTPWNQTRWTYNDLREHSVYLARYILSEDIKPGDRIGILAGNRVEYASVFFACMRIGAILVILNNTYTKQEVEYALSYTECKILFTTPRIGRTDNTAMVQTFARGSKSLPSLQRIILLSGRLDGLRDYQTAIRIGRGLPSHGVENIQASISPFDPCNLQLTSGSTGHPKVSTLHHYGLLNNARFIGDRMALTPIDVLCCPPPLFHCFGLVLGLLATITHGSKIVYPAEIFDGPATLRAITEERCTAVHGVPAMFDTLFSLPRPRNFDCSALRTGIIAGAPVPRHLMELLVNDFGMDEFTSSYGLTEASPTCFNAFVTDSIARRLTTVGMLMPHASAKVIDRHGRIVPVGVRGELCIAGYQLQHGYWDNPEKTVECMIADDDGTLWLHTGDEAVMDAQGYCTITGRFKDIIIRGGENIYPLEIEERLVAHDAVDRAVVVGVPDSRYGEQVAAFMMRRHGAERPTLHALQSWIRQTLGRHKVPVFIFWLGEDGVPEEVPITGSGKVKKFALRDLASKIIEQRSAKL